MAATLVVQHFTADEQGVPEQLSEALGCSGGVHPSTAAAAHHAGGGPDGFSWFAATHAERILGINGCDSVGPATTYLEFGDQTDVDHVLATLDHFGAVCVVNRAIFEGTLLDGRTQLEELCTEVGGELKVFAATPPD